MIIIITIIGKDASAGARDAANRATAAHCKRLPSAQVHHHRKLW